MSDVHFKEKSGLSFPSILTTIYSLFILNHNDFFGISFPLSLTLVLLYSVCLKVTDFLCEKNESITSTVKIYVSS